MNSPYELSLASKYRLKKVKENLEENKRETMENKPIDLNSIWNANDLFVVRLQNCLLIRI